MQSTSDMVRWIAGMGAAGALLALAEPAAARNPDGTLGLIRQPASTHPVLVRAGDRFTVVARAPAGASGWTPELVLPDTAVAPVPLPVRERDYHPVAGRWQLEVEVPEAAPAELYDLHLAHDGGEDTSRIAVKVFDEWPERYTFAHYADTQNLALPGATSTMKGIVRDLNALQPTFAIVTGDLVNTGEPYEYREYLDMLARSRVPTFHLPGNHDIFWVKCWKRDAYQERYERFVGPRNYSFDLGDHHFAGVELSGYKGLCPHAALSDTQVDWLERDLGAAQGAPLSVLFGHQVEHKSDVLEQLTLDHDIDMYLYGHIHEDAVPRTEPTVFAAVGWAGNGRYRMIRVDDDEVTNYTYAGDPVESIPGAYAVSRRIERPADREAAVVYTNATAQRFENVSARVEMPPRDGGRYLADGGEVWQTVDADGAAYVYVRGIEVAADGVTRAGVRWEAPDLPADEPGAEPEPQPEAPPAAAGGCRASGGSGAGAAVLAVFALAFATRPRSGRSRSPRRAGAR